MEDFGVPVANRIEDALRRNPLDADFGHGPDDLVDCLIVHADETFLDQIVPSELLLHAASPSPLVGLEEVFGPVELRSFRCDLARILAGEAAVQDAAPRERINDADGGAPRRPPRAAPPPPESHTPSTPQ